MCAGSGYNASLTGGLPRRVFRILAPCNDLTLAIQGGSRMRRRARTVLCGGCQVTGIPTATAKFSVVLRLTAAVIEGLMRVNFKVGGYRLRQR